MDDLKCQVGKCREPIEIIYYGKGVCERHWEMHCNESSKFNLKVALSIRDHTNEEQVTKTD